MSIMSKGVPPLNPFLLRFRSQDLESAYVSQQIDLFSHHLPTVVIVLAVMNITRIILYSVDHKSDAEIGWSVSLLVISLSLRCLLWFRRAKVAVILAAGVVLYLKCVEWIVSFDLFFCFEVRAILVTLGAMNVYLGVFLFGWGWWVYLPGVALGTVYLILRTNLYFDQQDVPSQLFTAFLPAVIVYLHLKSDRAYFFHLTTSVHEADKWSTLVSSLPTHLLILDLDSVLYLNPAASEFLQLQDFHSVHTALKNCYRKENPNRRFEDDWKDVLSPTSGSGDVSSMTESVYVLVRDDGAHHTLQVAYKAITWEHKRKAVVVTFVNVTKVVHLQTQETKGEIVGLMGACVRDMVKPGMVRTAGEVKMMKNDGKKDVENELVNVFYGLYCFEDLQKVITGGDFRPTVKVVNFSRELTKIRSITQRQMDKYSLNFSFSIESLPETVKIDILRYRQFLSLLLHALSPSALPNSQISLCVSPKPNSEIQNSINWTRDIARPQSPLIFVAEKLSKRLSSDGLKLDPNTVSFSFFAGFVLERRLSDVSLDIPTDEEQKGVMPPQNQFGLFSANKQ